MTPRYSPHFTLPDVHRQAVAVAFDAPDIVTDTGLLTLRALRKANIAHRSRAGAEGLREPECGSFYLHVDVWYRKSPWIASTGPDGKEFIDYLTNFERKFRKEGRPIYRTRWELTETHC